MISTHISTMFSLLSLFAYVAATGYLAVLLLKRRALQQQYLLLLIAIAALLHGISLYLQVVKPTGIYITVTNAVSVMILSINSIVIISSIKKPLQNIFIPLLPLSIVSVGLSLFVTLEATSTIISLGIGAHILLSIVAYSLLSMAVLQALVLHWQNSQLKQRKLSRLIKHIPSLQTMEALMFELIWVGVIILAAGILIGALYIDDIFAQNLAHKTILSIMAWGVFATLLFGRITRGWRGNQAVKWLLVGFSLLMLGYFGSKVVLDIIIS